MRWHWRLINAGLLALGLYLTGRGVLRWLSGPAVHGAAGAYPLGPLLFVAASALLLIALCVVIFRFLRRR